MRFDRSDGGEELREEKEAVWRSHLSSSSHARAHELIFEDHFRI
jgi:hypothetical protein